MNIVIVGAGGTGISALAQIFHKLGYTNLVCIDKNQSQITDNLIDLGINVIIGHGKYNVDKNDLVVYSDAAIDSPEVQQSNRLKNQNFKKYHMNFSYFQFLGEVSKYFQTVSIAGTHGKTTSTGMMMQVLKDENDFGVGILGGLVSDFDKSNYLLNVDHKSDLIKIFDHIITGNYTRFDHNLIKKYKFVIEADEFNYHFHYLDTDYALVTNIDFDHSDIYTHDEYLKAFEVFGDKVKNKIYAYKDSNIKKVFSKNKTKLIEPQKFDMDYMFGQHNDLNASLVFELAKDLGLNPNNINKNLKQFKGIWRRLEYLTKNSNGVEVYTDYAHHPTELKAVIQAMKQKYSDKNFVLVFQPHQLRRVLEFYDDFLEVLNDVDSLYLYDIYTARESLSDLQKQLDISNDKLIDIANVEDLGNVFAEDLDGVYIKDFEKMVSIIDNQTKESIVLICSAGDIDYKVRKYFGLK